MASRAARTAASRPGRLLAAILAMALLGGPSFARAATTMTGPTGLAATVGDTELTFRWQANSQPGFDHYNVYRQNPDGTWPTRAGVAATAIYRATGLTNGTAYTFRVTAVDRSNGESPPSAPLTATPKDLPPPTPTGLVGASGDTTAVLTWKPVVVADLAGYRIYRRTGAGKPATVMTSAGSGTTFIDRGLTNGTAYLYTVTAYDRAGNESPASGSVTVTPVDRTPPAPPTGPSGVAGESQASLLWAANTEPDFHHYNVYRQKPDGTWPSVPLATRTQTSYTDAGLVDGTAYAYRITAVDAVGNESGPSSVVNVTPVDLTPPARPTGLVATAGESQVSLSWQANAESDLARYALYRQNSDGTWPATPTATSATTSLTDTGRTDGTAYTYRLTAIDNAGNESVPSATVTATPVDLTAPAAPTGLVGAAGDGQASLSWQANSEPDVTGYRIYRQAGLGSLPVISATTQTAAVDSGLTDGTTYTYRITAVDAVGNESGFSSAVSVTPVDMTPPVQPTGLVATAGESQVSLSWQPNAESDLARYALYRQNADGTWPATPTATSTATSLTDTGLTDGTAYTYRLTAIDALGNESVASYPVTATPLDTTAPAAPTGLAGVAGEGQASLSWQANSEPDVTGYRIYRQAGLGSLPVVTPTTQTAAVDSGLTDGTTYTYRITAVDAVGNESALSAAVSVTPIDMTPPAPPTGLVATAGESQVSLTWDPVSAGDLDHYAVYRQNADGTWPGTPTATPTTTSVTDGGLTDGTAYTYRVTAIDSVGNESAVSMAASATPVDVTAPAAPVGLVGAAGDGQASLSWQANAEPDLDHYGIYRQNADGTWPGSPTTTSTSTSATDTGLTDGTAYTYRITAVDAAGNESAPSLTTSVTPIDTRPPAAPTGLSITAGESQLTLSWNANTEPDLDHYGIYRQNTDGTWPSTPTDTSTSASATETGLTDGTAYRYRVTAFDTAGNESPTSGNAVGTPVDLTPPAVPANLRGTPQDTRVDLDWAPVTDADFDHYGVYRQASDGSWPATPTATLTSTSYSDSGLTGNVAYTYRVTAFDAAGNESQPSATVTVTPFDHTPPSVPAAAFANPGNGQIAMSWPDDTDADIAGYRVWRQNSDGSWPSTPTATTAPSMYVATGLTNGQSYTYRFTAIDQLGNESAPGPAVTATPTSAINVVDPGTFLNGPNSVWSAPLAASAPLDPDSSVRMAGVDPGGTPVPGAKGGLMASIAKTGTQFAYLSYSSPVYVVGATQPLVPMHILQPTAGHHVALEQALASGVPIPAYAQSALGTDGHMTVYQPSTDTLWEFWRACSPFGPASNPIASAQRCPTTPDRTWTAQFGGVMQNVSQTRGYFEDTSVRGLSTYYWGATATSLPLGGGLVTMAELAAGRIPHALSIAVPGYDLPGAACAYRYWKTASGMGVSPVAWPAQRSDGSYLGPDCVPEGARLRIDPSFDLNSIQLPAVTRMVAEAAQQYGMIVRDHAAGGVQLFAEDPVSLQQQGVAINPYTDQPWNSKLAPKATGLLRGQPTFSMFKNFPWSHVQVVALPLCHALPGPCPPGGN